MIIWLTGNTESGKTTLAKKMAGKNTIILDGDDIRKVWPTGFTKEEREEHNLRVARLARMLEDQGSNVIVSLICPYKELRKKVEEITNCTFIYVKGGKQGEKYPYEEPTEGTITYDWRLHKNK